MELSSFLSDKSSFHHDDDIDVDGVLLYLKSLQTPHDGRYVSAICYLTMKHSFGKVREWLGDDARPEYTKLLKTLEECDGDRSLTLKTVLAYIAEDAGIITLLREKPDDLLPHQHRVLSIIAIEHDMPHLITFSTSNITTIFLRRIRQVSHVRICRTLRIRYFKFLASLANVHIKRLNKVTKTDQRMDIFSFLRNIFFPGITSMHAADMLGLDASDPSLQSGDEWVMIVIRLMSRNPNDYENVCRSLNSFELEKMKIRNRIMCGSDLVEDEGATDFGAHLPSEVVILGKREGISRRLLRDLSGEEEFRLKSEGGQLSFPSTMSARECHSYMLMNDRTIS